MASNALDLPDCLKAAGFIEVRNNHGSAITGKAFCDRTPASGPARASDDHNPFTARHLLENTRLGEIVQSGVHGRVFQSIVMKVHPVSIRL
jgi:hypothetical protein